MPCLSASVTVASQVSFSGVRVSSHQAGRAVRGALPYATAKAAVDGLTRALTVDYGPNGIRTNAVALGSIGTERYNQRLSERRAAAVKEYLVSKGIASSKVTTIGKGETQPVATNKTAEGRQKNRRVDIEFKGVKQ